MIRFLTRFLCLVLSSTAVGEERNAWLPGTGGLEIHGTGARQNPLRRAFQTPFSGLELFVRFRLNYDADSVDEPGKGDGEFFVLWLDDSDGGDRATHSGGVPNLGIHVKDGAANHFMARFTAGASEERYGPAFTGGKDHWMVGRLSKSKPSPDAPFDCLELWVNPMPGSRPTPDAAVRSGNGLAEIRWVGFSTGGKTEPTDRITAGDLRFATRWEGLFDEAIADSEAPLPGRIGSTEANEPETELVSIPDPPAYMPLPEPERIWEVKPPPESVVTDHWAFQPLKRPEVPKLRDESWVQTPIDAFVGQRHEIDGLTPAPQADDSTLTRRMALTITGLPPMLDQAPADFDAYADDLLDSPAYGESWARQWLDLARWAESNGYQHNRDRQNAWNYRDWVVTSLNRDLPYDEFIRKQIAGDEIEPFEPDNVVATGFLASARYSGNELDKLIQRNDILVDVVNTTAKTFLGLTMECAQCHDHFFDPLTQWDYYRMQAFFAQGQPGDVVLEEGAGELVRQRHGLFESVRTRMEENLRAKGQPEPILVSPEGVPKSMTAAEKRKLAELDAAIAKLPQSWAYYSPVTSPHRLAVAPSIQRWPLPFQEEALRLSKVRFL
ncbi:MAG: DUF1549 domain-containing protein, partial [Verrucomicrobiae bacterium]|nr:DUF1549 domain-containing protein [Verrucomicrobiae bacterium]